MSDENREEYKAVKAKMEDLDPLFKRMDEDEGLYLLEPFKMKRLDNPDQDESDVSNVTTNDPLLYAKKAIAIVGSYQRSTVVEGQNLTDKQTTKIEQFLKDIFYMADEWLTQRDIPGMDPFINEQACVRGGIPGRVYIRDDKKGGIIPDILPLDRRWFPYEVDENGFVWAAPIFHRSKAQIQKKYGTDLGVNLKNSNNEVIDFFNSEKEIVFVEHKIVKEQANPFGYPPFVQSICPIGTLLNTKDSIKHRGESIFWPNRNLWKEKNEVATILKTLNRKALKGGLQYASDKGIEAPQPETSPLAEDIVMPVEKGGGFSLIPVNDIKRATQLYYSVLETCLQRGELTPLDYGTLTFPLSSVAILNLLAARNDIFAPILSMIASYCQSLSWMVIRQCVSLGREIKLGKPGGYNTYSPSDFEGEYSIEYQFTLLSKEQTAADAALSKSLRGMVSDKYILTEILKVPNPEGMLFELQAQQAENTDEVLFLFNRGLSFLRQADDLEGIEKEIKQLEAKTLMQRIKTILIQRKNLGQLSPIEGKREEPEPEDILPLLEKGGTRGTVKKPAEEIET